MEVMRCFQTLEGDSTHFRAVQKNEETRDGMFLFSLDDDDGQFEQFDGRQCFTIWLLIQRML